MGVWRGWITKAMMRPKKEAQVAREMLQDIPQFLAGDFHKSLEMNEACLGTSEKGLAVP